MYLSFAVYSNSFGVVGSPAAQRGAAAVGLGDILHRNLATRVFLLTCEVSPIVRWLCSGDN